MNNQGLLTCLRYSLPPNSLSYCGPDQTDNLVGYNKEGFADHGLLESFREFTTLYRYLTFIAKSNSIGDAFDPKVVEAYWIGNELLTSITPRAFYHHLLDGLELKKMLNRKSLNRLLSKLNFSPMPHHSFHVLNIWRRTGHLPIKHTLSTMDACRISWGQVVKINKDQTMSVLTQPLVVSREKLALGQAKIIVIANQIRNNLLLNEVKPGAWVSFHWQVVCDIITPQQVARLASFTMHAIKLANRS